MYKESGEPKTKVCEQIICLDNVHAGLELTISLVPTITLIFFLVWGGGKI